MTEQPDIIQKEGSAEEVTGSAAPTADARELQVGELSRRIEELEGRLLRARADFANFQRSAAVERESSIRYANAELIRSLLTALDDFERCLNVEAASEDAKRLHDGVKLVYDNMLKALRDRGVTVHDPLHQAFNPEYHEAILSQPTDAHAPGTVIAVAAKGYQLGERLIRPARVVVAARADVASGKGDGG
ncbi:MAG: protein GrpE [Planctomycetota bacterium]|nr:MAG: protein GrpE [Planctomycetota bacterium]